MLWVSLAGLRLPLDFPRCEIPAVLAQKLGLAPSAILDWRISRLSVDARHGVEFVYGIEFALPDAEAEALLCVRTDLVRLPPAEHVPPVSGMEPLQDRPVVIGFGPAGIFAALRLAAMGYAPLVLERGKPLAEREVDVERFWQHGVLDPESNVQFGAGGAGTFSDGKLQSRGKDSRRAEVFAHLIEAGAPEDIAYYQGAHLGTDRLRRIVARLQEAAEAAGAEIRYHTKAAGLTREGCRLSGVAAANGVVLPAQACILSPGHSARDTFAMLEAAGLTLAAKAFAVGVRIEHHQQWIDKRQYRGFAGHPALGAADYRLAWQDPVSGRGVYTFCMCPGGNVIAAASEPEGVVVNGMSYADRGGSVANSAIVAIVTPGDFGGKGPLAGVEWQRSIERAAYQAAGGGYLAPCQLVGDFLTGQPSCGGYGGPAPTYRPGVVYTDLRSVLPDCVLAPIARALSVFNGIMPGFAAPGSPLTGVETRTSSPVRIVREADMCAPQWTGLYPAGEGAGYAGGIVSAAVDGLRAAEALIARFARP